MDSSNLFISFLVLFFMSNFTVLLADPPHPPYLFREYIGAEWKNITFSDVPINPRVDFHFILSFGIDYAIPTNNTNTTNTNTTVSSNSSSLLPYPTNGNFIIYWDNVNLSPWHVADIKSKNPNVKVAMALGGDSIRGSFVNFSPTTIDSWVSNAISSVTNIINEYHLDGIDIDYEHFNTDPDTFAECIGRLLCHLKENNLISFASIAPYGNETIQQHYSALWTKYGYLIDYVNFQFYAYENTTTVDQLLGYYEAQRWNYNGGKIIASFGTDGSGGLSPKRGFFKACKILHTMKKFHGIFIWSADNSKDADYHYEKKAQHFMAYAS